MDQSFSLRPSCNFFAALPPSVGYLKSALGSYKDLAKERRDHEMGKRTRKEGETSDKSTNFRWSIPMDRLFLKILADEATKGNKPSSSFKPASFVRVAQAINEKFGCECSPLHVENHLRTVKKTWSTISLLRARSGYGWDANLNMIVCDKQQYDEEATIEYLIVAVQLVYLRSGFYLMNDLHYWLLACADTAIGRAGAVLDGRMGARLEELVRVHGHLLEGRGGAELDGRGGAVLGGCKGQPVTQGNSHGR
ncbi:hypothetical protein RJ639_005824 [Escallonia herrerae]|uniref:Myb/SANT-like domain-containing protein n=1 Tax=Escallonia herrerae TaxID=1293975 RepID=A0AA88VYX2_9ASTE|nr:hypothetical protein RJ639_005824 [Escallonia herrerae]